MSAEKCGSSFAFTVSIEEIVREAPDLLPEMVSDRVFHLIKKIKVRYPQWSPFTVKEVYGKAYSLGLLEE